jgi:hypothetical protein
MFAMPACAVYNHQIMHCHRMPQPERRGESRGNNDVLRTCRPFHCGRYQRNGLLFDWFLVCTIVLCKPRMASNLVDDRIQKIGQQAATGSSVRCGGIPQRSRRGKPEPFPEELLVAPAELQKIQHSHMTMCQTLEKLDW